MMGFMRRFMMSSDLWTLITLGEMYFVIQRRNSGYHRISGTQYQTFMVNMMMQSIYSSVRLIGNPTKTRPETRAMIRTSISWISTSVQSMRNVSVNLCSMGFTNRHTAAFLFQSRTVLLRIYLPLGLLRFISRYSCNRSMLKIQCIVLIPRLLVS